MDLPQPLGRDVKIFLYYSSGPRFLFASKCKKNMCQHFLIFTKRFVFHASRFFSPYIRSQTRQPLDATIHQCSRASLRIPSWLSFTKLPPFSGLHDKFSTPLRSLFRNAHSISLGFVPSFQKLIFRIPCIVRTSFFSFLHFRSLAQKSNVRPAALKTLRGREHTSQHFSKDIMQILH